jgi:hypothetical protein
MSDRAGPGDCGFKLKTPKTLSCINFYLVLTKPNGQDYFTVEYEEELSYNYMATKDERDSRKIASRTLVKTNLTFSVSVAQVT